MFEFFFLSYRKGLLNFCGSDVNIHFDIESDDTKYSFKSFENGVFKNTDIITKHPNILKSVILGKKSWGLWVEQYSQGIIDFTFTKDEILKEFDKNNIKIPEPLMKEWDKLIERKKIKINLDYLNELKKRAII